VRLACRASDWVASEPDLSSRPITSPSMIGDGAKQKLPVVFGGVAHFQLALSVDRVAPEHQVEPQVYGEIKSGDARHNQECHFHVKPLSPK
jgi:hypothetical protein